MKAVYTDPIKTPLTFEQAEHVMRWALSTHLGKSERDVPDEVVALALAKTALETGRWTAIWNDNWGNIKAGDRYEGMFTCIVLNEVLRRGGKDVVVWFAPEGELSAAPSKGGKLIAPPIPVPAGHPQTRMRAFANEFDGADSYVEFVANGRYKAAWTALLRGEPVQYVHELRLKGYFTADEATYAKGVEALFREMLSRIRKLPDVPEADVDWTLLRAQLPHLDFDWGIYRDERDADLAG